MKKIICFVLFFVCITCFVPTTSASSYEDSMRISDAEQKDFKDDSGDIVVKLYNGSFMHHFANEEEIVDIVCNKTVTYMVMSQFGEVMYKKYHTGEVYNISSAPKISGWKEFVQYAIKPNNVFESSTVIYNVYCLNGAPSNDGVYIYYSTDKGVYVLYKEYLSADEEYLFPLSDFYQFAEKVHADRKEHADSDGGNRPVDELLDLTPYRFSPRISPEVITLVFLAVIMFLGVLIYVQKSIKKKGSTCQKGASV